MSSFRTFVIVIVTFAWTEALYEEMCTEEQLFSPYVQVFNGRDGSEVTKGGPGFYEVGNLHNIYVCINGPAWLYFYKQWKYVFEHPDFKIYQHTCQMFNGKKGPGATFPPRKLESILLLGERDSKDYRRHYIQLFTAPLYRKQYHHYENVTSLMTIGDSQCNIVKGHNRVELNVFPSPQVPESVCRLSYKGIPYSFSGLNATLIEDALRNDHGLQSRGCKSFSRYNDREIDKIVEIGMKTIGRLSTDTNETQIEFILSKVEKNSTTDGSSRRKRQEGSPANANGTQSQAQPTGDASNNTITEKISDDEAANNAKLEAIASMMSNATKSAVQDANKVIETHKFMVKEATSSWESVKTARVAAKEAQESVIAAQRNVIRAKKTADEHPSPLTYKSVEKALDEFKKARNDTRGPLKALSDAVAIAESYTNGASQSWKTLNKTVEIASQLLANKSSSLPSYLDREKMTSPVSTIIPIVNCTKLPVMNESCKAYKPNSTWAGKLFHAVLGNVSVCGEDTFGHASPVDPKGTMNVILTLIENIVSQACPLFPSDVVAKVLRLLRCYILSPLYTRRPPSAKIKVPSTAMSQGPPAPNASMNTSGAQVSQEGPVAAQSPSSPAAINASPQSPTASEKPPPAAEEPAGETLTTTTTPTPTRRKRRDATTPTPNPGSSDLEFDRDPFWEQIIKHLTKCETDKRELQFEVVNSGTGKPAKYLFQSTHPNGTLKETVQVFHHREQADNEFGLNVAIDAAWKVFATALGVCRPSYGERIQIITHRFYAYFTEEFLVPLTNTWISVKDNIIFRFILGNFVPGNAPVVLDQCLEAAFHDDVIYRPPRKLFVNDFTEANFFVNGKLAKMGRMYASSMTSEWK